MWSSMGASTCKGQQRLCQYMLIFSCISDIPVPRTSLIIDSVIAKLDSKITFFLSPLDQNHDGCDNANNDESCSNSPDNGTDVYVVLCHSLLRFRRWNEERGKFRLEHFVGKKRKTQKGRDKQKDILTETGRDRAQMDVIIAKEAKTKLALSWKQKKDRTTSRISFLLPCKGIVPPFLT